MQNREERWSWKIEKWSWNSHVKIFCQVCGNSDTCTYQIGILDTHNFIHLPSDVRIFMGGAYFYYGVFFNVYSLIAFELLESLYKCWAIDKV